jgi:hypothetical protein
MAKTPRKRTFTAVKAVKELAREKIGTPPPSRVIPDAKTKQTRRSTKHRPTLGKLLNEE